MTEDKVSQTQGNAPQDDDDDTSQQFGAKLYDWLGSKVKWFVKVWRRLDAWVNQPLPDDRSFFWKCLAPDGHAWFVPVLASLLIAAVALGPTFATGSANLKLLALGFGLLLVLHVAAARWPRVSQSILAGHLVILAILLVLVVFSSRPEVYGADSAVPRLHVGMVVITALIIGLLAAWLIALGLFRSGAGGKPAKVLSKVELFVPKSRYDFMGRGPFAAFVSAIFFAPIRYPVQILFPGSMVSLFVPDYYISRVFWGAAAVIWAVVLLGVLFDRLMEILHTLGRLFFIGPQRVISIIVIAVAILRLMDVHYITYLFNAGSSGFGNTTIMRYIALAYAVAWYYAFWCDIFVARRLIRLLDGDKPGVTPVSIDYEFKGNDTLSRVLNTDRQISLHGAGRLKIEGRYQDLPNADAKASRAIQFMSPADVLGQFRAQLERLPKEQLSNETMLAGIRNLQRSTIVYPVLVGAIAFLLIGIPTWWSFNYALQAPELSVVNKEAKPGKPLADLILAPSPKIGACEPLTSTAPRIAVVASGGGTRAAIYTASLLRGLAERKLICNVVAVSGVSGGSAALAYFALHENELRRSGDMDDKAWDVFMEKMAKPYIEYAIDGASDARITFGRRYWSMSACGEPPNSQKVSGWTFARSRLGSVLAEAFVCEMGPATMETPSFGILLNTSIVGMFDSKKTRCNVDTGLSLAEKATQCRDYLDGAEAGRRLVLTNLTVPKDSAQIIVINNPDVSVARAAALSANFPPVFPDAAVDVEVSGNQQRYWVTDGGAVENRGAMSLYYSIRDAVRSPSVYQQPLAPLHVVIADVSASGGIYSESFGFGSVLGAGGKLGLGLESELKTEIEKLYCDRYASFMVHEIMMPGMFTNGGIGTHWLLPNSLSFKNPADPSQTEILGAADVKTMVLGLHSKDRPTFSDAAAKTVDGWAHDGKNSEHDTNWQKLLDALTTPRKVENPNCRSASKW